MNLLAERLNRGLSLAEASAKMGLPFYVLRDAEKGTRPRPRSAKRIADFYEVRVTDIWPVEDRSAA